MKAIQVADGKAGLVELPKPGGDDVVVKVAASSICGSDLHLIELGWAEGWIPGHEFAGYTPDGTAVAVEPCFGCGVCGFCSEGYNSHCEQGAAFIGSGYPGGMAEFVSVPASTLVPLPTGLDVRNAALVEPLAVGFHALNQARLTGRDRVLVVGAGAIGLAVAAALRSRGMRFDIEARYPHQQAVAAGFGAGLEPGDGYDLVLDAVGTSASVAGAVRRLKPRGRLCMVGTFWSPVALDLGFCGKELQLLSAATYKCRRPGRTFEEAVQALVERPEIAAALVTHRFGLDAAAEAFATAADRAAGAIKVCFEPAL